MTGFEAFLVLAGLLVGSAALAAADRLAAGESWLMGRSCCPSCQSSLAWYELIPLVSWAIARGRCRTCKSRIGWASPASELAGCAIAVMGICLAPPGTMVLTVLLGWLLLTLSLIDLRMQILPDALNLAVLGLGGVMVALMRPEAWPVHVIGAVAGYTTLWAVEAGYRSLRGFDGLGRGDAKLFGALGMWTGWMGLAPALLVASMGGIAAVLISAMLKRQTLSATTAIAFGPWIALGGWVVWLVGPYTGLFSPVT